ncbi:MAG: hypothetical protein JNK72_00670 [Myxococcales bacterium]|nr:hypothetical protein [Myxococcales bacterium]
MARVFNLVVFDQVISGDSSAPPVFYTSQEHAALLGSVERLQVQLHHARGVGFYGERNG